MNAIAIVNGPVYPNPQSLVEAVAIRLADEGIPVRAIARSVKMPLDEVYVILKQAIEVGQIVELPAADWPVGSPRRQRALLQDTPLENEESLHFACSRTFKATRLEAAIFSVLLKRNEVTKQQLHLVIEQMRPRENRDSPDPKMVDVVICHLRKKLKDTGIEIKTVWGLGYRISQEHREKAVQMLTQTVQAEAA